MARQTLSSLAVCRERQLEGIAAAKERGVYRGRKLSVDPAEVQSLRVEEMLGVAEITRRLGIGRASVYRTLAHLKLAVAPKIHAKTD